LVSTYLCTGKQREAIPIP